MPMPLRLTSAIGLRRVSQHGQSKSVSRYCRSGIARRPRDLLDITLLVNGLAVFICAQIGNQTNWIAAQCAGYFWEGAATHKCLLCRVKSSVGQKRNPD
jgi:hypothetical protein